MNAGIDLGQLSSLQTQFEEERLKRLSLEQEILNVYKLNASGLFHELHCNQGPGEVGGGGCTCFLGKRIRGLQQRIEDLKAELAANYNDKL